MSNDLTANSQIGARSRTERGQSQLLIRMAQNASEGRGVVGGLAVAMTQTVEVKWGRQRSQPKPAFFRVEGAIACIYRQHFSTT